MATVIWDIDGVCVDLNKYLLKKAVPFFKNEYGKFIVKKDTIDIKEMFDCTELEEVCFWKHHLNLLTYSLFEKARYGLKDAMMKIKEEGDRNVICSARAKCDESSFTGKIIRMAVNYWIKNNGLPVDDIYYVSYKNSAKEKLALCRKLNPIAVVEDEVENIRLISQEFPVIKYLNDYNKNIFGPNIYSINCYDSLILEIKKLKNDRKCKNFEFLNRLERENLSEQELEEYYHHYRRIMLDMPYDEKMRERQEKRYYQLYSILHKIHCLIAPKATLLNPEMLEVIKNYSMKGKIFAVATHTSLDDIQQVEKILNEMAFFLVKSEISQYPIVGKFLQSIGCEYVVRQEPDSRRYSRSQIEKLVLHGKDAIVLPEGTRNRTTNPIGRFEKGVLAISQKTGHPIFPIVMKRIDDLHHVYLKIGEPRVVGIKENILLANKRFEQEITEEILNIEQYIQQQEDHYREDKPKKKIR